MKDVKRKRIVVTGPTSGIGKEIATQLGAFGANLVLGCRDMERGKRVAEEISKNTGNKSIIDVMYLDASSFQSIYEFSKQYKKQFSNLDVLVNNAGVNRAEQPREDSVDGIELTFATNVLGYYLLTRELLAILKAANRSRIVNVASTFASDLDLDDVEFKRRPYDGMKAYAQSKACDRLITWAFARRLEKNGISVNAMAPGLVPNSNLFAKMSPETKNMLTKRGGVDFTQAADTAVWLASDTEAEHINGRFFEQRNEIACEFRNIKDEEKLWDICEGMIMKNLPNV